MAAARLSRAADRTREIGVIAYRGMAAREFLGLDAELLDAAHDRDHVGIGGSIDGRSWIPQIGDETHLGIGNVWNEVARGVRVIERIGFDHSAALGNAPFAVDL